MRRSRLVQLLMFEVNKLAGLPELQSSRQYRSSIVRVLILEEGDGLKGRSCEERGSEMLVCSVVLEASGKLAGVNSREMRCFVKL